MIIFPSRTIPLFASLGGVFQKLRNAEFLARVLFLTFLFSLPFQTHKVLFQFKTPFSEYEAVLLWMSDILLLAAFVVWFFSRKSSKKEHGSLWLGLGKTTTFLAVLFFVGAAASLFSTANIQLSLWQLAKLGEMILLFVLSRALTPKIPFVFLGGVLIAGGMLQSVIAAAQFFFQHSLGLSLLGESVLDPFLPGVAKVEGGTTKLIRAYGTFPHPNVLAAFLVTALLALWTFFLAHKNLHFLWIRTKALRAVAFGCIGITLLFALFPTFSRASMLAVLVMVFFGSFFLFWRKVFRARLITSLFVVLLIGGMLALYFSPFFTQRLFIGLQDQAIHERLLLQGAAEKMLSINPLFGVGIGQFVPTMRTLFPGLAAWQYQPTHNLFLLMLAEIGVIGFLFFLLFLSSLFFPALGRLRRQWSPPLFFGTTLFLTFMILAFFDHYFWTLQQGRLLLWFALGYLAGIAATAEKQQAEEE